MVLLQSPPTALQPMSAAGWKCSYRRAIVMKQPTNDRSIIRVLRADFPMVSPLYHNRGKKAARRMHAFHGGREGMGTTDDTDRRTAYSSHKNAPIAIGNRGAHFFGRL